MADTWRNRIVGHDVKPASWFLANEDNWRVHPRIQADALMGVLEQVGWVQDVLVNLRNEEEWGARRAIPTLVDGHLRVSLALREGDETPVPLSYADLTPAEENLVLVTLDPITAMAAADREKLAELLADVQTEDAAVKAMLEELAKAEGIQNPTAEDPGAQIDKAAELQEKWGTTLGQLWEIGRHRLICGDCTDAAVVERLMGGKKAEMVFTDPPYNIAGEGTLIAANAIRDSYGALRDSEWDKGFEIGPALDSVLGLLARDATVYICTSQFLAGQVWDWMKTWADFYFYTMWCKTNPMPSLAKRHWTWGTELIPYATRGAHTFNFPPDGHALNWWEIPGRAHESDHPTEKPVEVPLRAIACSSKAGDLVFDGFLGSGTTMVAAEQLGRRCFACEIEPKYIAVTLERMAGMGLEPKLVNA